MIVEIKVPVVGESITEGVLVSWFKEAGAVVRVDDALFELETDKITLSVAAEQAGALAIRAPAGSRVKIGQIVGTIDTEAAASATPAGAVAGALAPNTARTPTLQGLPTLSPSDEALDRPPPIAPPAGLPQVAVKVADDLSPAVRRLVEEQHVDASQISGTGKHGRLTKEDVLRHLEAPLPAAPMGAAPAALPPTLARPSTPIAPRAIGERQTRTPISPLRQRIAERLLLAQQTAAILTTVNECDMSTVLALRTRHREAFQARHGVGLGLMSFFVKAAVDALHVAPIVNAQIQGDEIVHNHFYDIGVAVSTEHGLVVPVIRDADQLSFAGVEAAIAQLAGRARDRTLTLAELAGGTFTISNGGVYGSLLSTPILNPPQSGILGMHGIKKRPVVVDDEIVVRPMMYLALSYDHRLVDGESAVKFLRRVVECIENPERMLLEV
jgi:2-oxoglutarate dehydrogenase E2 component (dihydrolipoamide succinyltransferase)